MDSFDTKELWVTSYYDVHLLRSLLVPLPLRRAVPAGLGSIFGGLSQDLRTCVLGYCLPPLWGFADLQRFGDPVMERSIIGLCRSRSKSTTAIR
jgi:hypothetical protein